MCHSTIAIYCFIDDLLKASGHTEDCRQKVNDAQILTTALLAMLDYGGNYQRALLRIEESGLFSQTLSRSRFSRRLTRLSDLVYLLFHQLGSVLKDLSPESRYRLDSFPVSMCENIRIGRSRLTREVLEKEEYRGYSSSKKQYFFGLRVQVIASVEHVPVEFAILPGRCSDLQGLAEMPLDFAAGTEIFADAAYTEYNWEDHLLETEEVKLQVARKKNSTRRDLPAINDYKFYLRHPVETTIGEVEKKFPKRIHVTNLSGFILKVALFLWAFQIEKAFI